MSTFDRIVAASLLVGIVLVVALATADWLVRTLAQAVMVL